MSASATAVVGEDPIIKPLANHGSDVCPLCGRPNGCGLATDSTPCWCTSVSISESILKAIPLEARNVVCICKACATGAS
jgi:hypothetical protein